MRLLTIFLALVLPASVSSQDFDYHFVPSITSCSKIDGMVALDSMETKFIIYGSSSSCNPGAAFWMMIDTGRNIISSYIDYSLNSYTDIHLTDSSFYVSGRLTSRDFGPNSTKLQEFDYTGEMITTFSVLTYDGSGYDETNILSSDGGIYLAINGSSLFQAISDTLYDILSNKRLFIAGAESWNDSIYFVSNDTLYLFKDYTILRKERIGNRPMQMIVTGSNKGFIVTNHSILSWTWNDSLEYQSLYTDSLGISRNSFFSSDRKKSDLSTYTFCDVAGFKRLVNDTSEYILLSFSDHQIIDTVVLERENEIIYGFFNSPVHNIIIGTYWISNIGKAFLKNLFPHNTSKPRPCKDISVEVVVDSSWVELLSNGTEYRKHVVDFHLFITNKCDNEIEQYDLFSEDVIYFNDAEFRDYIDPIPIPANSTITYFGQRVWQFPTNFLSELCYVVQSPDGYTDGYPQDNISCDSIPLPIGVNTTNIYETQLEVFPNPAYGQLSINIVKKSSEVSILNMNGEVVLSGIIREEDNRLNVSQLAKGTYFIKLHGTQGIRIARFIKM